MFHICNFFCFVPTRSRDGYTASQLQHLMCSLGTTLQVWRRFGYILVGPFCWILSKLVKKVFTCHCFLSKKTRYERHGDPSNTRPTKWRLTNSHRYGPWCHHCHQHNTLIYNVSFLTFCSPLLIRLACKLLDDLGLHQKTLSQKWYIPVIAGNTKH